MSSQNWNGNDRNGWKNGGGKNYGNQGARDGNRGGDNRLYQTDVAKITNLGFVDEAERVIKSLNENKKLLSTSKIRGILSLVSDLNDQLSTDSSISKDDIKEKCGYIRMRFAYESGRDTKTVKPFVQNARLIEFLKDIGNLDDKMKIKSQTELFCKYMEALVAYHKYYGGNE